MQNKALAPPHQKTFIEKSLFLIGLSMIVLFFSEYFFLNEEPSEALISKGSSPFSLFFNILEMTLWYVLAVSPAFLIMLHTRICNLWGLFLSGAIAGYSIEGLVVPPLYLELPISLIWTSLSWHPIIDIIFGIWVWQYWLRTKSFSFNLLTCAIMGAIWAIWATWPVGHLSDTTNMQMTFIPLEQFVPFVFMASFIVFIGNLLITIGAEKTFSVSRGNFLFFLATSICLLIIQGLSVHILVLLFPCLVIFLYLPLHYAKNKYPDNSMSITTIYLKKPSLLNQCTIWVMPLSAALVYHTLSKANLHIDYMIIVIPLALSGIILTMTSLFKLYTLRACRNARTFS